MDSKFCTKCNVVKPVAEFYPRTGRPGRYEAGCRTCRSKNYKAWYAVDGDKKREANRKRKNALWAANPIEAQRKQRAYQQKIRHEILAAYGDACACCSEREKNFLAVDHIKGGGAEHLRSINVGAGFAFYLWLKRNGFPKDDFRLLCHNCNVARGLYGVCPHETGKLTLVAGA